MSFARIGPSPSFDASPAAVFAGFDDPNLLAQGGVTAVVRLAERCGLPEWVREKVRLAGAGNGAGAAPDAKAMSLVVGMLAGADSIDDVGVLRHGAMAKAFATEAAQRIVDDAVQVLGGRGVLADHPVDRLYRAVRALRIYEGTTEIQHLVIAGHLLADGA